MAINTKGFRSFILQLKYQELFEIIIFFQMVSQNIVSRRILLNVRIAIVTWLWISYNNKHRPCHFASTLKITISFSQSVTTKKTHR